MLRPGNPDTPAFRRWFGQSVVVDADGKPAVAYHGTKARFSVFCACADGNCFTTRRSSAAEYAGPAGIVMDVFLRIENPYVTDGAGWDGAARSPWLVKEEGEHDGYIVENWAGGGHDMYIVFSPHQIKSVCANSGDFDPADPDIYR